MIRVPIQRYARSWAYIRYGCGLARRQNLLRNRYSRQHYCDESYSQSGIAKCAIRAPRHTPSHEFSSSLDIGGDRLIVHGLQAFAPAVIE
jgi:hypothetical protein